MAEPWNISDYAFRKLTGAVKRYVPFYKDAGTFKRAPKGWILHVAVSNGSLFDYFSHTVPGSRKFSHLWVAKNGTIEQYGSLRYLSWAQAAGNSDYWSVETEGVPGEALTSAQIVSLARIHRAFTLMSGVDLNHIINTPGQVGIGTHQMGGAAWGGHSCPGPKREGQRAAIIAKAKTMSWKF